MQRHYYVDYFIICRIRLFQLAKQDKQVMSALDQLCGISQTSMVTPQSWHSPYNWTSVPLTSIGSSNLQEAATFSYTIPNTIPSSALEVLVYVALNSGPSNKATNHLKIHTQIGTKRYEKYLFLQPWDDQSGVSYNSDNMWFPMPPNRLVHLTVTAALGDNAEVFLYTIGYR